MDSGEPSGIQMAAYFFALALGRRRRMMPCRMGSHNHRGSSTTRGSPSNPARNARTSRVASEAGVPELTSRTPYFMAARPSQPVARLQVVGEARLGRTGLGEIVVSPLRAWRQ